MTSTSTTSPQDRPERPHRPEPIEFRTMREVLGITRPDLEWKLGGLNRDMVRRWDNKKTASKAAWELVGNQIDFAADMINTALDQGEALKNPDADLVLHVYPSNDAAKDDGIHMPAHWHRSIIGAVALNLEAQGIPWRIEFHDDIDLPHRCAEFRTMRETLGITRTQFADMTATDEKTVHDWDIHKVAPEHAWQTLQERITHAANTLNEQAWADNPAETLNVYPSDDTAEDAGLTIPASWHRTLAGHVALALHAQGLPYRIHNATKDN